MTTQHNLTCGIAAVASCGKGFDHWEALQALMHQQAPQTEHLPNPKPAIIPANERRRAPLPVRLAVAVCAEAVDAAAIDPTTLKCVFTSGLGDTQLTDYMCRVLATENKQLSPTKFHNSVHNAPAGYWTISTGAMQAANSVAGFKESVSSALLEAVVQCHQEHSPVLFACYDAPVARPLQSLLNNQQAFAAALVLLPDNPSHKGPRLQVQVEQAPQICDWPVLQTLQDEYFTQLYQDNPAARILSLLEQLARSTSEPQTTEPSLKLPLSCGTALVLQLSPQQATTP
ncbi:MAG: beta-ketoacyl synthase chain length factor [Cellvibrionaceae bacterium]|nr:beta-ketoacyl synthase chain length factor [Cellvibrionaceae bacterium]